MEINAAKFVWEKMRLVNRLPGAHASYKLVTNIIYRDGRVVTLGRGPAAGYRWRHYRCFQPWMAMGVYEPHVAALIKSELKPGDVFYDIGANAGYFTLVAARAVGPTGKVIAFDPNPKNVLTVREQISLNGLESICTVEPLAVSDECGSFHFVVTAVNANAHLQEIGAPHVGDEGKIIEVQSVTLDKFVADHPFPALIKMDVEGAEVAVLKGSRELLRGPNAPRFLVSTHSDELDRESKNILRQNGYTFINLEGFEQMIYALPAGYAR